MEQAPGGCMEGGKEWTEQVWKKSLGIERVDYGCTVYCKNKGMQTYISWFASMTPVML